MTLIIVEEDLCELISGGSILTQLEAEKVEIGGGDTAGRAVATVPGSTSDLLIVILNSVGLSCVNDPLDVTLVDHHRAEAAGRDHPNDSPGTADPLSKHLRLLLFG